MEKFEHQNTRFTRRTHLDIRSGRVLENFLSILRVAAKDILKKVGQVAARENEEKGSKNDRCEYRDKFAA